MSIPNMYPSSKINFDTLKNQIINLIVKVATQKPRKM